MTTPKEKARELYTNNVSIFDDLGVMTWFQVGTTAKDCAMITAKEVIQIATIYDSIRPAGWESATEYWEQVKSEIEKL